MGKSLKTPHSPVLLAEFLQFFADRPLSIFVDGTLGAGGHAEALLEAHPEIRLFVGIDQDPVAREIARERLGRFGDKVSIIAGNFRDMRRYLLELNIEHVDGIFLDLGVSSMQLDTAERGFSFSKPGPLDMRMDPSLSLTAGEILNTWSEKELGEILREYGEVHRWRLVARAIVEERKKALFSTTEQFAEFLVPLVGWAGKKIHPATLVFQGLRLCVNEELGVLEQVLPDAMGLLSSGGRFGVISFHSLEDRIVKTVFKEAASNRVEMPTLPTGYISKVPVVKVLTKKPVEAGSEELKKNPRSRSAKLRFVEKLDISGVE